MCISQNKKIPIIVFFKPNCQKLPYDSKNESLEIGSKGPKKLGIFFSLFLMKKPLSSGQKWFLRLYFPLIRGIFLLRSGLRFSFWARAEKLSNANISRLSEYPRVYCIEPPISSISIFLMLNSSRRDGKIAVSTYLFA